jgi:uncharacterized membrane protein
MATVNCPACHKAFNAKHYLVKSGAFAAGAATGAWLGSGVGLVAGPIGAIAGTFPGAVIGGVLVWLGVSKLARCPSCSKIFKI